MTARRTAQQETTRRRRVYGVAELLSGLNALFEDRVGRVWVRGEIGNLHRAGSGHSYFTLKEAEGQIRGVLFRTSGARLPFELEEGLEVLVYADVSVYEARGDLQLIVRQVEPVGRGALQLAFEQLRRRLDAEGLFDPARKRPIPQDPRHLGVVTSPTSAAVRDVIHVASRRSPAVPIMIGATRVQGEGAEFEIAAALDALAARPEIDLILLVRGGGSLEDLWAFNTEVVARAIARCRVPVVTGVGHETDFTIADWVADLRAPTPSAAVANVLPDRRAQAAALERIWGRLLASIAGRVRDARSRLAREEDGLRRGAPATRLALGRRELEALERRLARAIRREHQRALARMTGLGHRLAAISPLAVLRRGYALVRRLGEDRLVRAAGEVEIGDLLDVRLGEGRLRVVVERRVPGEAE